jgi:hypothetical protein
MADDGTGITLATLQGRRNKAAEAGEPNGEHVDDSWHSTFPDVGLTEYSPGQQAVVRQAPDPGPQSTLPAPKSRRK